VALKKLVSKVLKAVFQIVKIMGGFAGGKKKNEPKFLKL
jgi:hypothetical protein